MSVVKVKLHGLAINKLIYNNLSKLKFCSVFGKIEQKRRFPSPEKSGFVSLFFTFFRPQFALFSTWIDHKRRQ
jgi:hypothetical protein